MSPSVARACERQKTRTRISRCRLSVLNSGRQLRARAHLCPRTRAMGLAFLRLPPFPSVPSPPRASPPAARTSSLRASCCVGVGTGVPGGGEGEGHGHGGCTGVAGGLREGTCPCRKGTQCSTAACGAEMPGEREAQAKVRGGGASQTRWCSHGAQGAELIGGEIDRVRTGVVVVVGCALAVPGTRQPSWAAHWAHAEPSSTRTGTNGTVTCAAGEWRRGGGRRREEDERLRSRTRVRQCHNQEVKSGVIAAPD